jgi:predicted negative regulator of RcsB-dependent stress response
MSSVQKVKVKSRFVFIVLGLSIVLVGAVVFATRYWHNYNEEQIRQLDRIVAQLSDDNSLSTSMIEELVGLQKSSLAYVRNEATLLLAEDAHRQGNMDEALALYQELALQRNSYLAPKARLNSAYILLALQRTDEALAQLEAMRNDRSSPTNPEVEVLIAFILESSDLAAALSIYQDLVVTLDVESTWRMIAQARLLYHDGAI